MFVCVLFPWRAHVARWYRHPLAARPVAAVPAAAARGAWAMATLAYDAYSALAAAHVETRAALAESERNVRQGEEARSVVERELKRERERSEKTEEAIKQHKGAADKFKDDAAAERKRANGLVQDVANLKAELVAVQRQLALAKEEGERQRQVAARATASAEDARARCQRAEAEAERQHAYASGLRRDMDALVASVSKSTSRSGAARTPSTPSLPPPTPVRVALASSQLPTAFASPAPAVPFLPGLSGHVDIGGSVALENADLRAAVQRLEGEVANLTEATRTRSNERASPSTPSSATQQLLENEVVRLKEENEQLRAVQATESSQVAVGRIAQLEAENARLRATKAATPPDSARIAELEAENARLRKMATSEFRQDQDIARVEATVQAARLEAQLEETRRQLSVSEETVARANAAREAAQHQLAQARTEEESWMRKAVSARADSAAASSPSPTYTPSLMRDIESLREENLRLTRALESVAAVELTPAKPNSLAVVASSPDEVAAENARIKKELVSMAVTVETLRAEKCELEQRLYAGEAPEAVDEPSAGLFNDAQEIGRAVMSALHSSSVNASTPVTPAFSAPHVAREIEAYTAEIAVLRRQLSEMQEVLITNESRRREEEKVREAETAERIRSAEDAAEQRAIEAAEQAAQHGEARRALERELDEVRRALW